MIIDLEEKLGVSNFTFDSRDEFRRKQVAEKLIKLLKSDITISPMVIDGKWGSGKTEFCIKLINLITAEHKDLTPIYVNSFKYDHSDDPFLMVASVIANHLKTTEIPTDKDKLIKAAIPVGRVLLNVAGRAGINWLLRGNAEKIVADIAKAVSDSSDEIINSSMKALLNDYEGMNDSIKDFKEILKEISEGKNIVIFIDELDRCKPTFALSLLERIKHIFNVENIQFVLTTNMEQLGAIVKKQYGHDINAEEYLSKFFTFKAQLSDKEIDNDVFYPIAFTHFDNFLQDCPGYENISEYKEFWENAPYIRELINHLLFKDGISLRGAEEYFKYLQVLQVLDCSRSIKKETHWIRMFLSMIAIYIFAFHREVSNKIVNNSYDEEDIQKLFNISEEIFRTPDKYHISKMIAALFFTELNPPDNIDPQTEMNKKIKKIFDDLSFEYRKLYRVKISKTGLYRHSGRVKFIREIIETMQFVRQ